jgi:anti-anti-sigma factor
MAKLAYRIRGSVDKIVMVELSGFINAATIVFFEEILDKLLAKQARKVILDFYHVNYVNSTGIGTLFNYYQSFLEKGIGFVLIRIPQEVGITMHLLGLTDMVPCLKSREDANRYFEEADRKKKSLAGAETVPSAKSPADAIEPKKRSRVYFFKTKDFKPTPESSTVLMVVPQKDVFTDIMEKRLHSPGGRFHIIHSASEALEKFDEINPDLLILEDRITDSEEFLSKVKIEKGRSLVSLVKLYPHGTNIEELKNFKIWENDYLIEPFEMMELFALAEAELRRVPKDRRLYVQQVHFQFRSRLAMINRAQELAANLIRKTNLSAEEGTAFSAAFREAVDNANRHGHRSNEDRHIDVVFLLEPSRISITVEDEGEGFNWGYYLDQVKNLSPDKQAQLRREAGQRGGLGIMLMKKCTDVLEYVGKGNVVRLIKNLK